jgi:hypothetical protein
MLFMAGMLHLAAAWLPGTNKLGQEFCDVLRYLIRIVETENRSRLRK